MIRPIPRPTIMPARERMVMGCTRLVSPANSHSLTNSQRTHEKIHTPDKGPGRESRRVHVDKHRWRRWRSRRQRRLIRLHLLPLDHKRHPRVPTSWVCGNIEKTEPGRNRWHHRLPPPPPLRAVPIVVVDAGVPRLRAPHQILRRDRHRVVRNARHVRVQILTRCRRRAAAGVHRTEIPGISLRAQTI